MRTEGRATIVVVTGELDLASSPRLQEELERVWASDPEQLVIDLRQLEFMDSTGLSIVVGAHRRLAEQGRSLSIVRGSAQVQRLLDLTGVADRLQIVDSLEEAVTQG
jgi:anti-sigma B factor antagonist